MRKFRAALVGVTLITAIAAIPTNPQAMYFPPPPPAELLPRTDRLAHPPRQQEFEVHAVAFSFVPPPAAIQPARVPLALLAGTVLGLFAFNVAFVGHLRRAYASHRRGAGRRG